MHLKNLRRPDIAKRVALLLGLWSGVFAAGVIAAAEPERAVYGVWRIAREVTASTAAQLSGDEIESLLGAQASYGAQEVNFAGEHCARPVYDTYYETKATLQSDHELLPEDIDFQEQTALAVEIGCMSGDENFGAGTWLLVLGKDRLLTEVDGVYFVLERQP